MMSPVQGYAHQRLRRLRHQPNRLLNTPVLPKGLIFEQAFQICSIIDMSSSSQIFANTQNLSVTVCPDEWR